MPTKRIIPCLDVRDGAVVKGVQFRNHRIVGDILELADRYCSADADELVFYDITASPDGRRVDRNWVTRIAEILTIPFCVAGGIRSVADAEEVLNRGADKISVNTPALESPELIDALAKRFGSQCVVVGIDSYNEGGRFRVHSNTGNPQAATATERSTEEWVREVQHRGAGEIVLNCMNQDGVRKGYDCEQLRVIRKLCAVPLVASGGAGTVEDFIEVFRSARVDAALAATVFHDQIIAIPALKTALLRAGISVRPPLPGLTQEDRCHG